MAIDERAPETNPETNEPATPVSPMALLTAAPAAENAAPIAAAAVAMAPAAATTAPAATIPTPAIVAPIPVPIMAAPADIIPTPVAVNDVPIAAVVPTAAAVPVPAPAAAVPIAAPAGGQYMDITTMATMATTPIIAPRKPFLLFSFLIPEKLFIPRPFSSVSLTATPLVISSFVKTRPSFQLYMKSFSGIFITWPLSVMKATCPPSIAISLTRLLFPYCDQYTSTSVPLARASLSPCRSVLYAIPISTPYFAATLRTLYRSRVRLGGILVE